jgi:predicted DNA-binding transcriptional regulator AlpA
MRSFSIADFCALHHISRAHWYKINAAGQGPKTFKIGCSVRISETANNEWQARLEAEAAQAA